MTPTPPPPAVYPHARSLGAVIHGLRRHREMKLSEVSKKAEISIGYLSGIELARDTPTIHVLARIGAVFGLSLSKLFELTEKHAELNPQELDVRSS